MALASEFQRKQQLQAKQFQDLQDNKPSGPKPHPEDTLIVRNILVGDDTEVQDVIPYANARSSVDPNTGAPHFINQIETDIYEHSWNTRDFFEVRWDGRPHRIRAGETRRMPRYLADHFAKHLIDFILAQREEKEKLTGLVKNRMERAKLYKEIIVGVDSYYNGDLYDFGREGQFVEQQVQQLNQSTAPAHDLGEVPPVALGYGTTDKPPEAIEDFSTVLPTSEYVPELDTPKTVPKSQEDLIANKTIHELRAEAKILGMDHQESMKKNKDELAQYILKF